MNSKFDINKPVIDIWKKIVEFFLDFSGIPVLVN